jgi:hypothetical protein
MRRLGFFLLCAQGVTAALAGCGAKDDGPSPADAAPGGTTDTGVPTKPVDAASAPKDTAGPADAAATVADAAPAGTPGTCPDKARLSGSIKGMTFDKAVDRLYGRAGGVLPGWNFWFFYDDGLVLLSGSGMLAPGNKFVDGMAYATRGIVQLPAGTPSAGSVFCSGAGTLKQMGRSTTVSLPGQVLLGSCPGTPMTGTISICHELGGAAKICKQELSGTVDGVAVATTGTYDHIEIQHRTMTIYAPDYLIRLDKEGMNGAVPTEGKIVRGLIVTSPTGPFAGAVLCVGGGTYKSAGVTAEPDRFELQSLSRLGACPAAPAGADTIDTCFPSF